MQYRNVLLFQLKREYCLTNDIQTSKRNNKKTVSIVEGKKDRGQNAIIHRPFVNDTSMVESNVWNSKEIKHRSNTHQNKQIKKNERNWIINGQHNNNTRLSIIIYWFSSAAFLCLSVFSLSLLDVSAFGILVTLSNAIVYVAVFFSLAHFSFASF